MSEQDTEARGRRRSAAETTSAMLRATIELLAEVGFDRVTTDDIAARAGVSKATIYRRWRTKEELVIAAASDRVDRIDVGDLGSFRAEIDAYLRQRMNLYQTDGMFRLIAGMLGGAATNPAMLHAVQAWVADLSHGPIQMVRRGQTRGDVRADMQASTIVTLISGPQVFRLLIEMETPNESLVVDLIEMLTAAVAPPG